MCLSEGVWSKTEEEYSQSIDLSEYVKGSYLEQFYATKQDLRNTNKIQYTLL